MIHSLLAGMLACPDSPIYRALLGRACDRDGAVHASGWVWFIRLNARLLTILFALLSITGAPAVAQIEVPGPTGRTAAVQTIRWIEEWDPVSGQWERVEELGAWVNTNGFRSAGDVYNASGLVVGTDALLARFGPFVVLDADTAAISGSTDAASPRHFDAMLAAYPRLKVIEFRDASGTTNDLANLAVGRKIRAAGLATHVPSGGSARSGAVELFLAGVRRSVAADALFAVHSWRDGAGREPGDFPIDAPENRLYLDYYAEMGMTPDEARSFYAMTNSVPHAEALWLKGADMERWIPQLVRWSAAARHIAWRTADCARSKSDQPRCG